MLCVAELQRMSARNTTTTTVEAFLRAFCKVLASMVHTTPGASSISVPRVCTVSAATRSRNASAETLGAGGSVANEEQRNKW